MTKIKHFQLIHSAGKPLFLLFLLYLNISPAGAVKVSFQADLSYEQVNSAGVHLAGTFNNWNPGELAMQLSKDNIYTVTIELDPGIWEYKFINGNTVSGAEIIPDICRGTTGRYVEITDKDTILPPVNFGSCWQGNSSFLHRKGRNFYLGDQPIKLRGVNLGNWLVFEPYMFKSNGPDQHGIINGIRDLVGSDDYTQNVVNEFRKYMVQEQDIEAIAAFGFNHVRVPLHYNLFYDSIAKEYITTGFSYLDSLVKWCTRYQVLIILDMHRPPGSDQEDDVSRVWTEYIKNRDILGQIWQNIAAHYKDESIIGGYDLLNEPTVNASSDSLWKLRDLYVYTTGKIREVDRNHLVIAEGNWWSVYLNDISPSNEEKWDMNMALSIHNYWSSIPHWNISNQVGDAERLLVPLWLGEFGENSNPWYNQQRRDAEFRNIGWAYWTWKKMDADINTLVKAISTPGFNTIGNYWKNGGNKPSAADAYNWLMAMAQNCAYKKCVVLPDVVDALIRSDFHSKSVPFAEHTLPVRIYAVNYDMGNNTIAYKDLGYQTISQDPYTPWNDNWKYRNDGVDIYATGDGSIGFHVGGIEDKEWLLYTVNVPDTGYFNLSVRLASPGSNSKFYIAVDNVNITGSISVPYTGGWQNWKSISIPCLKLNKGTHKVKFFTEVSGFNLNWLEFTVAGNCNTNIPRVSPFDEQLILRQISPGLLQLIRPVEAQGTITIDFFDLSGRHIYRTECQQPGEALINIPTLPTGIYTVRCYSGRTQPVCRKLYIE